MRLYLLACLLALVGLLFVLVSWFRHIWWMFWVKPLASSSVFVRLVDRESPLLLPDILSESFLHSFLLFNDCLSVFFSTLLLVWPSWTFVKCHLDSFLLKNVRAMLMILLKHEKVRVSYCCNWNTRLRFFPHDLYCWLFLFSFIHAGFLFNLFNVPQPLKSILPPEVTPEKYQEQVVNVISELIQLHHPKKRSENRAQLRENQ